MSRDEGDPRELTPSAERFLDALVARAAAGSAPQRLLDYGVPPASVDGLVEDRAPLLHRSERWRAAVDADLARAQRLDRAMRLTEEALAGLPCRIALSRPILGTLWQSDLDLFVAAADIATVDAALREACFLAVESLLGRLGRSTAGVVRLGALADREVLASVELCTRLYDGGPKVDEALARATGEATGLARLTLVDTMRRRCSKAAAARKLPARTAVELLTLLDGGAELVPDPEVTFALRRAAALERKVTGGPGPLTAAAAEAGRAVNTRWLDARMRRGWREVRRRLRPRRVSVAFCGVDDDATRAQATRLVESLDRLDVPVRLVDRKRGRSVKSASGVVGPAIWLSALAATAGFIVRSRPDAHRAPDSVLVSAWGLPDVLVDLYMRRRPGARGAERGLMGSLARRSGTIFYLRGDPRSAPTPGLSGPQVAALERRLAAYEELLVTAPGAVMLDGSRAADDLAFEALRGTLRS